MKLLDNSALHIRNYKSFGADEAGFDEIRPINVVIGRNNSGKSALIDAVELACSGATIDHTKNHKGSNAELLVTYAPTERGLRKGFNESSSGGGIDAPNHWAYGKKFLGVPAQVRVEQKKLHFIKGTSALSRLEAHAVALNHFKRALLHDDTPFARGVFRRINAERDIKPENLTPSEPQFQGSGAGVTSCVAHTLQKAGQPSDLIDIDMVRDLNIIMGSDGQFRAITVQEIRDGLWEIYLVEESGMRVALSDAGSGLKTILHVIANFVLAPHYDKRPLEDYIFGFEELENNLHPALQRRLFSYVRDKVIEHGCVAFLTTHSGTVIDLFSSKADCSIVHVSRTGMVSKARSVTTYVENKGVLEDLDVRASDLLQANALVWLEGPSDRIYFNRWIDLWTGGRLQEGSQYQCVYYGGKLLAHVTGLPPDDVGDELIAALRVNKNAILLMDSDLRSADGVTPTGEINETKKRILGEFSNVDAVAWVTAGREIENYLPLDAIRVVAPKAALPLGRFEDISEFLERALGEGAGARFRRDKVGFARQTAPSIQREHLEADEDVANFLNACTASLARWNQIVLGM